MVCGLLLYVHIAEYRVEISEFFQLVSLAGYLNKGNEYLRQHFRIVDSAVVVKVAKLEFLCHRIQLEVLEVRERSACKFQRISVTYIVCQPLALAAYFYEGSIKIRIMRDKNALSGKRDELLKRFFFRGSVLDHCVSNAGEFGYVGRNGFFRVDKCLKSVNYLQIAKLHRAYFCYAVKFAAESGGLYIEHDDIVIYRMLSAAGNQRAGIVDKIRFHAVDYLELPTVLAYLFNGVHCFGVCLNVAVVGYGYSLVSPRERLVYQVCGWSYRVHIGHGGMQVEFHALLICLILALLRLYGSNGPWTYIQAFCECIELKLTTDDYRLARLDVAFNYLAVFSRGYHLEYLRGSLVGKVCGENERISIAGGLFVGLENLSPQGHFVALAECFSHFKGRFAYSLAVEQSCVFLNDIRLERKLDLLWLFQHGGTAPSALSTTALILVLRWRGCGGIRNDLHRRTLLSFHVFLHVHLGNSGELYMYRFLEKSSYHALNRSVYAHLHEHFTPAVFKGNFAVFTVVVYLGIVKVAVNCAVSVLHQRHYLADIVRRVERFRVTRVNTRPRTGCSSGDLALCGEYFRSRAQLVHRKIDKYFVLFLGVYYFEHRSPGSRFRERQSVKKLA
ncbi:unknown [Eubacterium sp. CAG:786]|nr:unknown [Eubacterium sp. CAG:786]